MSKGLLSDGASRIVFACGAAAVLAGFIGIFSAQSEVWVRFFDNMHWTAAYCTAAALAWLGAARADEESHKAMRWFAIGLSSYALGQILWDIQIAAGWNPFPGPSDLFFVMLGPCCTIGLLQVLAKVNDPAERKTTGVDLGLMLTASTGLVLAVYLPLRGETAPVQLAVIVAYPVVLMAAAGVATLLILQNCPRPQAGWMLFYGGLLLNALIWMQWNALTLDGMLQDGSLFNTTFSIASLAMGLGANRWEMRRSASQTYRQLAAAILRLTPLVGVIVGALAVNLAFFLPGEPQPVRWASVVSGCIIAVLAIVRQYLMIRELGVARAHAEEARRSLEEYSHSLEHEIRERRSVEAKLRSSEEQFSSLFHNSPLATFVYRPVLDESGRIVDLIVHDLNALGARTLGSSIDALLGRRSQELFGDALAPHLEIAQQVKETGIAASYENYFEPLGRYFYISSFMTGDGFYVATVIDITERKEAEQEKVRLEERLFQSQKMESIGQLAGGVAHDFNNMLMPVLLNTEMLIAEGGQGRSDLRELREIQRAAERLKSLTRQLLAFSRQQSLRFEELSLNELLSSFENMLRRTIREDIEISVELDESARIVKADPLQIEQVILNLALNARDAMPGGGRLWIETGSAEIDAERGRSLDGIPPGRYSLLKVRDTGTGMSEEVRRSIFEPFFTTKEIGKGTGLGLATVYGIVRQHQGAIEVTSQPGEGSEFCVYLPTISAETVAQVKAEAALVQRGTATIILVEDQEDVRHVTLTVLRRNGYNVYEAASAEAALEMVESIGVRFDLLISDIVMGKMNGLQLYEELCRRMGPLRVVFMSGYMGDEAESLKDPRLRESFIEKPFKIADFLSKVREVLERPDS